MEYCARKLIVVTSSYAQCSAAIDILVATYRYMHLINVTHRYIFLFNSYI